MFTLQDFNKHFVISYEAIKRIFKRGRFIFSIKKCPIHANPYPDKRAYKIKKKLNVRKNLIKK
jgi:hypothetical protein